MKRSKLLIGFSMLALLLLTISYGCRKTTIKFKKVDGTWKLTEYNVDGHTVTTTDVSYVGAGCPASASVEVTDDATYTLTESTYAFELDHNVEPDNISNPDYSSNDDMTLTVDVVINEDGTYQITMTYSYTTSSGDVYSGTVTTDLNHWYMGESNENNSSIMFESLPVFDFGSIVLGNIVYQDRIMYFDQELTDKDNMIFNFSGNWTEARTEVEDVFGCEQTTETNTTNTTTGSATMAREE